LIIHQLIGVPAVVFGYASPVLIAVEQYFIPVFLQVKGAAIELAGKVYFAVPLSFVFYKVYVLSLAYLYVRYQCSDKANQ
jgi:hypothetical protein